MDDYQPPRYLQNGHAQSVLVGLRFRQPKVRWLGRDMLAASRSMLLDCGDGVTWQGYYSPHAEATAGRRRLAILIHGWEGSADSLYLISAAAYLYRQGYEVFRLNMRDHGPTHHLNVELFHSGRIDEAVGATSRLQRLFQEHDLYLAGFSLGGNFSLRIAARAPEAGIALKKVVAVCPVLDPASTLRALDEGWFGYRHYFVSKWRRSLLLKQKLFPNVFDFQEIPRLNTLTAMTDRFVTEYGPYPSLQDYLSDYAITGDALAKLSIPASLILAKDDPVIPVEDLERMAIPTSLEVVATEFGGHCGYLTGMGGGSWIDGQILSRFEGAA